MKHETKCSDHGMEQTITDDWIVEGQRFLNQHFGDDLMFPIYVVRAPTEGDSVLMSISGEANSLHYRDKIVDWQGGGYLIRLRKNQASRLEFNSGLLHELSHAFQSILPTPWTQVLPGMKIPPCHVAQGPSPVYWNHVYHKADFWRLCFHVWKRASLAGFVCSHTKLGVIWVDLDAMRDAIEDETIELLDMPLWKIARRPVPKKFQKLFDIDLSTLFTTEVS